MSLKIGKYLMKLRRIILRRTEKCANFFGSPCSEIYTSRASFVL